MSPKKKMSKKERARLEAEQAEHHRMELEKERQRKVEEEKMRKVREKEEAERKQVQEIVANKLRKVQLEESYTYLASIREEVRKVLADAKKEREWEQYMRCNGLPNAFDPADLRKYLHIWCENIRDTNEAERNWLLQTNEQSILTQNVNVANLSMESLKLQQPQIGNTYAAKAVEVLGILEEIDEALHDSDVRPSMVEDLNELKMEFRNVLADYIDEFAYKILSNINRDMELNGLLEVSHKFESPVFKTHLFGLRDMPTPQLNPKERAKEDSKHTSIDFPSLGFHLTLPAAVKCHKAAIRGLWISYDHCSDYCPSYDMPYKQENLADLRIISRIEWKKRKEILKAVYEEPKEKKTDSDEDDQTPQDIDVDKIYTEHADELMKKERTKKGAKTLNLSEYDVNMRSHRIVAGVYAIDYLEQPMQDVKIAKKTLLRTVPQPGKLKRKKFYQPYRPPPTPQPGVRRLPEEIEAEIKQMEENLDKLALVSVQLPENVFWFEPPIVCRWELKEETLESDPNFAKYLDRLEKAQQAARERNERSNLDRRTKYVEDFNILDVPQHIPLRAIVTDFVIPKLPDSCSIKISVAEDKRRAAQPTAAAGSGGGKRSSKQKRRLHKMPSNVSLGSIVYETKIPDFLYATRNPLRILKVLDRRNRQCYPYAGTSDSDDLDDYDESDNDVVQNRSTKRKVYMFSSFMKDLDELLESKSPKLQAKMEQELGAGGPAGGPGKQSLQVARSDETRTVRGEKGEKGKKPAKSKFDSDDEDVDYGNILEVGNYSMVENDKRYIGKWSTRDVHDVKFNEDKLTIQFRVGRLGSFAFAANRYSNVPYQSWELKPDIKNPGTVTFSLTASVVSTEMTITEAGFRVNSLQGGPTQALQEILGLTMSLRKLIKTLRLAAVDLFPEDDAFNYTEGTCEKNPIMESHLYDCIGLLALTHNFSWSRWNLLSGCRMCVLLMREIVEHRRLPNHSTLLVTPLKASVIDTVEVSPVFNPNPVEGMNHYADLYHLGRDQSQPSSRIKQEKMSPILRENVTQLLKSVRPLSFS
ncbi:dynein intermediate chain CFAP94, axonemal isoform X2 [Anopheles merus]|uniref:dynein intermediate chain CFAP94, axonemal isoform X2 n=1 Tax=Anopheles merus TaxID=30066 RepID=UPI001BE4C8AC|nr:dynein intermediate chain CFAP94, axonemal isoform X2 [Anopheles merus]